MIQEYGHLLPFKPPYVLDSNNKWPNVVFAISFSSKVNFLKQKCNFENCKNQKLSSSLPL